MFVSHLWRPGVLERAICKDSGPYNLGYHAFKEREQAEREASTHWSSTVGRAAPGHRERAFAAEKAASF
jgi:hypothetical protein